MDKKILSISIAAYNMEKLIAQCVESFLDERVAKEIELIITDDGGKDKTMEIVEGYAKKYPDTIKMIRKQNEGPGSTVNCGIQNATGKYFRMVDGDDWVNTENFVDLVNYLRDCDDDMVVCDYAIFDNSCQEITKIQKVNIQEKISFKFEDVANQLPYEMHSTIYKTEKYVKNNIKLDNCFYTDVEYQLFPIPYVETVSYFNKVIYVYRVAQSAQSVSPKSMMKNFEQHNRVLNRLISFYQEAKRGLDNAQREYIVNRIALMCDTQLGTLLIFEKNKANKQKVKKFVDFIKKNAEINAKLKQNKKFFLLKASGYLLYPLVRMLFFKKNKIANEDLK